VSRGGLREGGTLGDDGKGVIEQVEADDQRGQQPDDVAAGAAGEDQDTVSVAMAGDGGGGTVRAGSTA
jgi:hypothetical protein